MEWGKGSDSRNSRAWDQSTTENVQLNLGEIPAQIPVLGSWGPADLGEHRYKVWAEHDKQCYESYGDKNYHYARLCDYSETWMQDNLYRRQP